MGCIMNRLPLRTTGAQCHWEFPGDNGEDDSAVPPENQGGSWYLPIPVVIYERDSCCWGPKFPEWACPLHILSKLLWLEPALWQKAPGACNKMPLAHEWDTDGIPKLSTWGPLSEKFKWWVRVWGHKSDIQVPITALKKKKRNHYFPNILQNSFSYKTIYRILVNRFPHQFFQPSMLYASSV